MQQLVSNLLQEHLFLYFFSTIFIYLLTHFFNATTDYLLETYIRAVTYYETTGNYQSRVPKVHKCIQVSYLLGQWVCGVRRVHGTWAPRLK